MEGLAFALAVSIPPLLSLLISAILQSLLRLAVSEQFALTEASYVIVRMVQCFSAIEARDDMPYTEYYTIALFSKNGVKVGLTPSTAVA